MHQQLISCLFFFFCYTLTLNHAFRIGIPFTAFGRTLCDMSIVLHQPTLFSQFACIFGFYADMKTNLWMLNEMQAF